MKGRLLYIDIAKGIGILFVVIGHTVRDNVSHSIIFSFHMPLFFILSGCFIKPLGMKENWPKVIKSLIIPYLFACAVSLIYTVITTKADWAILIKELEPMILVGGKIGRHNTLFMPVIWFLPVLALAKLITQKLLTYKKNGRELIVIISISSALLTRCGIIIPFGISQALTASLFLLLGKFFMERNLVEVMSKRPITLCFTFIVSLIYCNQFWVVFQWNKMPAGIFNYLISSFIVLQIVSICRLMEKCKSNKLIDLMVWVGRFSLLILCVHFIGDKNEIINQWVSENFILDDNLYLGWLAIGICRFLIAAIISYTLLKFSFILKVFNYTK